MTICKIDPRILAYIEIVESGSVQACIEQHLLVSYVRNVFETEDIRVDQNLLDKYLDQIKYFPYDQLFPWEEFALALHCCTFRADGHPRWPDLFLLMGRGAGKDGYIAFESWCLAGPYNGIPRYDVDICANNEDQARAPFDDIWNVLEDPSNRKKLTKHFYWNKEEIIGLKTKSRIKYRTNNPKGKDGLRSGIVVFNEVHQYQDYANINVFTTGLGKKPHPRRTVATTNGDVRDGPLDHYVEKSIEILKGSQPDNGWLPLIFRLDKKEDVQDPKNWPKANPSLPWRNDLVVEITKEYSDWVKHPEQFTAFMTKRMNLPEGNPEIQVTEWENILKANEEVPDLSGCSGVGALDYASIRDFAAAGIMVKKDGIRYWITHSWMCLKSKDLSRLKIPWREWAEAGYLTLVDDIEINPDLISEWFAEQAISINISKIVIDNFRYALVSSSLLKIGFDAREYKNVKLTRPSDIIRAVPVIDSSFNNGQICWGKNPLMNWYTNNTKKMPASPKEKMMTGPDEFGNYKYGKIEPKTRKTDGFMAFVMAMTEDSNLVDSGLTVDTPDLPCFTF